MKDVTKLERNLLRAAGKAISDFDLIVEGDRIMVAVSGGKDSYALLHVLMRLRERAPIDFDLVAVNLDQGQPGFPAHVIEEHLQRVGVPYRMLSRDTYSVVKRLVPEGKTTCSLCSRLRRGVLYNAAVEMGCTKIALGHHRDDLIETLLLSALYSGALKSMPPRLRSLDGRNVVIRPLCYAAEEEIAAFADEMKFPIVPCDLCGSQPNLRRRRVKRLLDRAHRRARVREGEPPPRARPRRPLAPARPRARREGGGGHRRRPLARRGGRRGGLRRGGRGPARRTAVGLGVRAPLGYDSPTGAPGSAEDGTRGWKRCSMGG